MVEDVFALGLRLVFIFAGIADALAFSAIDTHLGNAASGADVDVFPVRGRHEAVHSLLEHPYTLVLQIHRAEIISALQSYYVEEFLSVLCKEMGSYSAGIPGQAEDSVLPAFKVELDFLNLLHTVFLLIILLVFLLVAGKHLGNLGALLVPEELCHCLGIEEHDVYVSLCSPASVAAVTVLV